MKTSLLLGALTIAMAGGCNRDTAPDNQSAMDPADTAAGAATSAPPADAMSMPAAAAEPTADDSLALGLLGAVNEHEIAAARQAKEKDVSKPVMDYAQMMETEHGANQSKAQSLGTMASPPEVQSMKDKHQRDLEMLGQKSGKEYETAYVDAMVKGHTEVLTLIDTRLMTLASSDPVKQHLTTTRDSVAMHLDAAQKLQGKP